MSAQVLAPALFAALAVAAGPPQLVGTVGPGFTISLADAQGNRVTHVDPGTYTLLVHDKSAEHDFHIFGPGGVDVVVTSVEFVGDATVTLTLVDGNYQYQCDPHVDQGMAGLLSVGNAQPPATTTTAAPPPPPKTTTAAKKKPTPPKKRRKKP